MTVRDAVERDLPAILEIYNDIIATSTAVYRDAPATLEDRLTWWRAKLKPGYPTLVADDDGPVIGFATFGDFRLCAGVPLHRGTHGARAPRPSGPRNRHGPDGTADRSGRNHSASM